MYNVNALPADHFGEDVVDIVAVEVVDTTQH